MKNGEDGCLIKLGLLIPQYGDYHNSKFFERKLKNFPFSSRNFTIFAV